MRKLLVVACIFAMPSVSWARGDADLSLWNNLFSLEAGQKIQVIDAAHKKHKGKLVAVTDVLIIVHEKKRDQTILRENVLRVSVTGRRLRNTGLGLGFGSWLGASGGVVLALLPDTAGSHTSWADRGEIFGVVAAFGIVAGTLIGLFAPTHSTIYQSR